MIGISHLRKEFPVKQGVFSALSNLDLNVGAKEFFVLLGPSGSGKSTLLRCVAGIETPDEGEIMLGGRVIFSSARGIHVRPEERGLGMVFQSYAVWPHMTVYQNVALPLTHGSKRIPKAAVRDKVMSALSLVQMERLADRPVPFLSGGQQQRVALARALAVEPVVLLMDEPLSNLDARLREEVRHQIKIATKAVGVTVLYVTHDQTEAVALADRIAVMNQGRILQIASPNEIYSRPSDPMVADFLGLMNWIPGEISGPDRVDTPVGPIGARTGNLRGGVRVGIRPSDLEISLSPHEGAANELSGRVLEEVFLGDHIQLRVQLHPDVTVEVRASRHAQAGWTGRAVYCRCRSDDVLLFSNRAADGPSGEAAP
jgi:iron(III) transport system ATP-binding protein